MQLNMLRGLVKSGVTEFGGYPYPIDTQKRWPDICTATITNLKRQCPTGLKQMKLVEMNHPWKEKFTFGCGGDTVHTRTHTNGVLVELPWGDHFVEDGEKIEAAIKRINAMRHYRVVYDRRTHPDTPSGVRLVTSHKALIVPWGEYALVEAEREKIRAEAEERHQRWDALADRLRIPEPDRAGRGGFHSWHRWDDKALYTDERSKSNKQQNDAARHYADEVAVAERWSGGPGPLAFFVNYEMPMPHAQKIADILDALRTKVGDSRNITEAIRLLDELDQQNS